MEPEEYEKKCDKPNSRINSKLQMIYISSYNDRQLVTKTTLLHLLTLRQILKSYMN